MDANLMIIVLSHMNVRRAALLLCVVVLPSNGWRKKTRSIPMRAHKTYWRSLNISGLMHDVEDVRIVINLDFPPQAEDYIHRIGRTARSGAKGTAYSFFTRDNAKQAQELIQILKDSNQDVNEKLSEMTRMRGYGGSSRGGGGFRGRFERRGFGNGRSDDRGSNGFGNPRPSPFSNKRSRSRSPAARPEASRFDSRETNGSNGHSQGHDYKRARTDTSRTSHDQPARNPYSSSMNGAGMPSQSSSSSSTHNSYGGHYNQAASYPPPSTYPPAYQAYSHTSK